MRHPRMARVMSAVVFWGSWPVSYMRLKRSDRTRVLVIAGADHVLVLKSWHAPYKWTLPGGGIRSSEEYALAAARELYEETSIALGVEKFHALGDSSFRDRGLRFRCHYFFVDLGKIPHTEAHPPEVLEIAWLPIVEVEQGIHPIGADVAQAVSAWRKMLK